MPDKTTRILLIEDEAAHAELIQRAFEGRDNSTHLIVASSLTEARKHLKTDTPNLIIADWRLPDGDSLEFLNGLNENHPPIIIMTSYGNERTAVDAIKAGALDYVVKSSESMLDMPHIAEGAIRQWESQEEQKRIQNALEESESQFRLLAENSLDMISRLDKRGVTLYVSPASKLILGYDPSELTGKSCLEILHPEDSCLIQNLFTTEANQLNTTTIPYRARHKNGEYIWLETTARLLRHNGTGELQEIHTSSRDITERKQSQLALQRAHQDLQDAYDRTIEGWVRALDLRDQETEGHTKRVTQITLDLARALGFGEEEIVHIRRGALLHDIGKMAIPDEILQKPGPLSSAEWDIMRRHPVYARDMLNPIAYLRPAIHIPYSHHERWNGSGYPRGLKGEDIPLIARLFAVVDVWDALCSDRPYRKKCPPHDVKKYLRDQSGILFDPNIVGIFLSLIEEKYTEILNSH